MRGFDGVGEEGEGERRGKRKEYIIYSICYISYSGSPDLDRRRPTHPASDRPSDPDRPTQTN